MTVHRLALEDAPRRLLQALAKRPRSRAACAQLLGDPCVSAEALRVLRDLRLVRFDGSQQPGEWYATDEGGRQAAEVGR